MSKSEAALSAEALVKRAPQAPIGRDNILGSIEALVGPTALVFSLWALALYYFDGALPPPVLRPPRPAGRTTSRRRPPTSTVTR